VVYSSRRRHFSSVPSLVDSRDAGYAEAVIAELGFRC
jgi:hypothetical protein